jgi:hypothetical protein
LGVNDRFDMATDIQAAIGLDSSALAAARAYPHRFVEQLLLQCRLPGVISADDLAAYLREAGAIYLSQKAAIAGMRAKKPDTVQKRRHKTQLQKLAKSAQQLNLQLLKLGKPASDLLWMPISNSITEAMSTNAHLFVGQVATHSGGEILPISLLNREKLQQALTAIEILATGAANALAPEKGGRPHHPGLTNWVVNIHRLWTGRMGQPFTVGNEEDGASAADTFVGQALHALDPAIGSGTLHTVMRAVREEAQIPH